MTVGALAVMALATYRTTRIFTVDKLSEPWRVAVFAWAYVEQPGSAPRPRGGAWRTWLYELISCPYCLSVWCAGALFLLWRWGGPSLRGLIAVLAIAGVAAFMQSHTREDS